MRRTFAAVVAGVLLIGMLAACGRSGSSAPTSRTELVVSAAASLTDSLREIQAAYEKEHGDTRILFNLGSSGALQKQIEQGVPADLFISAGKKQMDSLVDQRLIAAHGELLTNELVVVVAKERQGELEALTDLSNPEYAKLAIGEPGSVPAGSYAKEALEHGGLWDSLASKLVYAKDVRQVLTYVETGNADAGFVYKTDALASNKAKIAFIVDPQSHEPIEYPVGVVQATKHEREAQQFYEFLHSEEALGLFEKYGFGVAK